MKKRVDTEEDSSGISSKQVLIYVGIVLACFAVVYPRMIHPMVKMALGFGSSPSEQPRTDLPPQVLNRGKPIPGAGPAMRPPPGARGGGEAEISKGGGGGMLSMILPLYAGGIFLYLMYAASKAYKSGGTTSKKMDPHEEVYSLITDRLAGLDLEKVLAGEDADGATEINKLADMLRKKNDGRLRNPNWMEDMDDEDDDAVEIVEGSGVDDPTLSPNLSTHKCQPKPSRVSAGVDEKDDTDELLRKCENHEHMTPEEMLRLKNRLSEVEGRMNQLMSAIQTVQTKPSSVASELLTEEEVGMPIPNTHNVDMSNSEPSNEADEKFVSEFVIEDDSDNDEDDELSSLTDEGDEDDVEDIGGGFEENSDGDKMDDYDGDMEMGGVRRRTVLLEDSDGEDST